MLAPSSEMEDQRSPVGIAPLEDGPEPALGLGPAQKPTYLKMCRKPLRHQVER